MIFLKEFLIKDDFEISRRQKHAKLPSRQSVKMCIFSDNAKLKQQITLYLALFDLIDISLTGPVLFNFSLIYGKLLSCQPRVTVTSCFVYNC